MDKISNIDEFVRRIYSVIHSNDPIARAVTLRIFGAVASIIPERQQIHHCIRSSLDSHDSVEVDAAIFAAIQFAAQSRYIHFFVIAIFLHYTILVQTVFNIPLIVTNESFDCNYYERDLYLLRRTNIWTETVYGVYQLKLQPLSIFKICSEESNCMYC